MLLKRSIIIVCLFHRESFRFFFFDQINYAHSCLANSFPIHPEIARASTIRCATTPITGPSGLRHHKPIITIVITIIITIIVCFVAAAAVVVVVVQRDSAHDFVA